MKSYEMSGFHATVGSLLSLVTILGLLATVAPAAAQLETERLKQIVPRITAHKSRGKDIGAGVVLTVEENQVLVLTAYHVVEDAEEIEVLFFDRTYQSFSAAPFERVSETLDVAVLIVQVESARDLFGELPTVDLANSLRVQEGDSVYPLGHPLDLQWQLSRDNTVEALIHEGDTRQIRFTRGSIDKGNSGGPIFDSRGALLGMVGRKHPIHGVAVTSNALSSLLEDWKIPTRQWLPLPDLGILVIETVPADARILLNGEDRGASDEGLLRIEDLIPGSYKVEVSKPPGYRTWSLDVGVAGGETQRIMAALQAMPSQSTFLVAVLPSSSEPDPGLSSVEATLLGRLARSGYSVVDSGRAAEILRGEGVLETLRGADPPRVAALAREHGAEVILLGRLRSEAQPAMGRFHTGRAVLDLQCFRASNGQYLAAETLHIGAGREPGKLGPSELVARTEASKAVAELAAEKVIELVIPQLQEPEPGSKP